MATAPSSENKLRATKRKLDDAFQVLDRVVSSPSSKPNSDTQSDRPSPPKRANTFRSIYSTLSKYGIKTKEEPRTPASTLTKSTPHLTAILNRAASRTKSTFSFRFNPPSNLSAPPLPQSGEYRPSSLPSFLSRLETYKISTYTNKPPVIDAVAAAKCGWINDGKDRLVCGLCSASWVVIGREGLTRDAANALIEKQRVGLVESHKLGCPWRTRQCDPSIYCVPLKSPSTMAQEIKSNALVIDPLLNTVSIKHPLSQAQLRALYAIVVASSPPPADGLDEAMQVDTPGTDEQSLHPSQEATLTALFGWMLIPPTNPSLRRSSTRPRVPRSSAPSTPARSRASSVSLPGAPSQTPKFTLPTHVLTSPENALLQCHLCQRRIGLWAFISEPNAKGQTDSPSKNINAQSDKPNKPPKTQRSFDLLREHRSYCPYVVRSTVIPSLPIPPQDSSQRELPTSPTINGSSTSLYSNDKGTSTGATEGWKAVLTTVLRSGMARRHRIEQRLMSRSESQIEQEGSEQDTDNVKAMVTGVKQRGGRDLLRYVRSLLG